MNEPGRCEQCGRELRGDEACPRCLLAIGLENEDEISEIEEVSKDDAASAQRPESGAPGSGAGEGCTDGRDKV